MKLSGVQKAIQKYWEHNGREAGGIKLHPLDEAALLEEAVARWKHHPEHGSLVGLAIFADARIARGTAVLCERDGSIPGIPKISDFVDA